MYIHKIKANTSKCICICINKIFTFHILGIHRISKCALWPCFSYNFFSLVRDAYVTILLVSWETCMRVRKEQLKPCMEQLIGSKLKKQYNRAICCHPVCLIYMLSTSGEMPCWMNYKLVQDRWEKLQQPQICGWYHSNGRKQRGTKQPLDEGEGGEWKSWLKLNIKRN